MKGAATLLERVLDAGDISQVDDAVPNPPNRPLEGILHCLICFEKQRSRPARARTWRSASAILPALALTPLAWYMVSGCLYLVARCITHMAGFWREVEAAAYGG